ncbi:head GIN domain-containing protein [Mucilaginibacter segetis]|uniref:DUF2807 domain-containing protein n=1 Tax=Mucilaginibacter segetis TaxID=2793071 RepID=A0A934UPI0_9SPHI|nr:head GIN domain-containing protein [Mucilaginibacter segetis]MBK0380916.1 DUF2807 domain-containing protein [Mucilaginibacter segetis]
MKKNQLYIVALAALISVSILSSCGLDCVRGSGNETTDNRKLGEFDRIDISGAFKVTLVQDSSMGVSITADDNLLKYIITSVNGGKLRIHSKRSTCNVNRTMVTIGVRDLKKIEASGAVTINSNGRINTGDLDLDVSGATKVTMDLNAATLNTSGSGATELHLTGQAGKHNVDLSGTGKIDALDFVVGKYDINTRGASHCRINVLNALDVHSSGASDIVYKGNPSTVNNDKSGASSIKKIE